MREVSKHIVKKLRINEFIRAREVRLVGEKGEQLGVMPLTQALEAARKSNLDLVEVSPVAVPPVCRLLDYGKYIYTQAKKERQARKSQRISLLREVRLRPNIGNHDFEAKVRIIKKLLDGGDKVKVVVLFRGREITHLDNGSRLLQRVAESLKEVASIDGQPSLEGKRMNMIFSPAVTLKVKAREVAKEALNAKT